VNIGTWNLENLFRPGADAGPRDDDEYDAKIARLARVVTGLAPDVLAVQEVGDPEALADLARRLEGEWRTQLSDFPDERGIRVGFLSRRAMQRVEHVHEFPDRLDAVQVDDDGTRLAAMGRGALKVRVRVQGESVDLVTCHLKSKLLTFPGGRFEPRDEGERARFGAYALYRRTAEAATVREHANALLAGEGAERAVVVLGDLNDEAQAATTQLLLGPPGSEIGTAGFRPRDQGDGMRLWNLAPLIPEARRFTRIFRDRREMIDHILVSRRLVTAVDSVDTGTGQPPSITERPAQRRGDPVSDHLPVLARFTLG
jgi:endonuclease/exonuclease/phosphatase family metal-dependent hydrolase